MPDIGHLLVQIGAFAMIALPLLMFALIIYLLWRTLQVMPRIQTKSANTTSEWSVSWDEVAGLEEARDEMEEIVDFLRDSKRFAALGARGPKGILLYGPPGTGKTLLAKAVAHESGASFYSQSASAFVEMFAGLGAARIRKLFEDARKSAPAIVFIDELDAVGTARTGRGFNREQDQTLNQLLVELDGFNNREQVIVMGASNRLQDLDQALLRPGRFDRQILVSPPDLAGREAILQVHTRGKPLAADVEITSTARQRARLHVQPAGGGALPPHARGVHRLDEDRARRPCGRAGHLRPGHERRRERPREGHAARTLDGLRVRNVRGRRLAHHARRQL